MAPHANVQKAGAVRRAGAGGRGDGGAAAASAGVADGRGRLAVVIGGCGFLGRHMVEELLSRNYRVTVFDVRQTFEDARVERFCVGDIRNRPDLLDAFAGAFVVFHCASPAPSSNNRALFYAVNVDASENVVGACKSAGVERLVLTSSASVVFEGRDMEGVDETTPYARKPIDYYTETKILQEKAILAANESQPQQEQQQGGGGGGGGGRKAKAASGALMTCAVRPHGIFGPHDPQLVPTVVATARQGKMKYIIGDGKNLVDFTYVRNVVHGHICAAEALGPGSPACGQAFHITNDQPIFFWDFMGRILEGLAYDRPYLNLPYWLILGVAWVLQFFVVLLSPLVTLKVTFSPMRVALAGTHHYYSCAKAKEMIGYKPLVSLDKGIEMTVKHFEHLRNPKK